MYITETTNNVKELFEKIEESSDIGKNKFLIYILNQLNNNQINNENKINPNIYDDENLIIFNSESCGLNSNIIDEIMYQNITLYNKTIGKNELYEEHGNVIGLDFDEIEMEMLTKYESLSFYEKLDVFSEIFIRYDNNSYYKSDYINYSFSSDVTGFEVARIIKEFKK